MLLVWSCLQHISWNASVVLTGIPIAMCVGIFTLAVKGVRRLGNVPLPQLSVLCLFAAVVGIVLGKEGWENRWRQYWWLHTGIHATRVSAATPTAATGDAAVLDFRDNSTNRTMEDTSVDTSQSAGFKNERQFYCVAPVLTPDMAGAGYSMVNYWAVGIDCCQNFGSFTCDGSRDSRGAFGIVMLDDGYPCPGCNRAHFAAAVNKAEHQHGLVSARGARYVRWVVHDSAEERAALVNAVFILAVEAAAFFWLFLFLGIFGAWFPERWLHLLEGRGSPKLTRTDSERLERHEANMRVLGVDTLPLAAKAPAADAEAADAPPPQQPAHRALADITAATPGGRRRAPDASASA